MKRENNMKKQILLFTACALMLTGCGKIDSTGTEDESGNESISDLSVSDNGSSQNKSHNVQAVTSSVNVLGEKLSAPISDAEGLYDFVMKAQENAEIVQTAYDPKLLTVGFKADEEEYILSACTDDVFAWAKRNDRKKSEVTFFKPDSDSAAAIRDMMLAYSALGYVLEGTKCSVVPEHTQTDGIIQMAKELPSAYDELRYYYIDDDTTRLVNIATEGEALYYSQTTSQKTDVTIDDAPYYQDIEFYEYFTNGSDKAFYRPEGYDVYYIAEKFEGDIQPVHFIKEVAEQEKYLYSFTVKTYDADLTVEVWQGDGATDYILIEEGSVKGIWNYREGAGITLISNFLGDELTSGFIDEIIAHSEDHVDGAEKEQEEKPSGNEELIKYDTEKYGLFDLSGGVTVGGEVEPTGVVEEWRDYISSEEEPFTLELRWAGSGRNEYEICTFDGQNYYYRSETELHDDPDSYGVEEWRIDGRFFQSIYPTGDYESREITEGTLDEYAQVPIELLFENEKQGEEYAGKCERAYEVTINNESYICEEWSLMLNRLWKVYIKDGSIVAWEGDFYKEPTVNTVIRLEKSADNGLLKIPEGAKKRVSYD